MHRGSIHQRHPKAPFKSKPCGFDCYTVLAPVSKCYPLLMGRLPTCYSPVRHSFSFGGASSGERKSVRLACIRHAASVRPEPGSNSHNVRLACIRHAASVRPEPGSNSHNDLFERSIGSLSSNKINFASYCLHVFCFINEAPYTLVRLLALFSFQRSTALR